MLPKSMIRKIDFEIDQIEELLLSYNDLIQNSLTQPPSLVEITALASVLHSFYNGVENIFCTIAKGIDQKIPDGDHWHTELLNNLGRPSPHRDMCLSSFSADKLKQYLAFRHYYRHSYSFHLDWAEMKSLVEHLQETWTKLKIDIQELISGSLS